MKEIINNAVDEGLLWVLLAVLFISVVTYSVHQTELTKRKFISKGYVECSQVGTTITVWKNSCN